MAVEIEKLSMPDFLALLRYEGDPPPSKEFDHLRMTPEEWAAMFPPAPGGPAEPEEGAPDARVPEAAATPD